ncbi:cysteine desulfurase family protein [Viridibacterium curvum]|uniref:Cysteine desulfurase NifS n=1 Tax=Viridibacterium curvum TaxID=1101404 RepID=A0ABP9R6L9_9RHOO
MIYLDHNATTRPLPKVISAMNACMQDCWGNPSSKHPLGQEARRELAAARAEVGLLLRAQPVEIIFTSGATESNHHVLHGALHRPEMPRRIILSAIEHAGYMKSALRLRQEGVTVDLLPVDSAGRVRLDALREMLQQDAALISVMAANNETGVLQPVREIAAMARERGIPMHVDATQMLGKLPLSFAEWGADLMSVSAHKLHGPKGIGALVVRKGLTWSSLLSGQQERARRGGTENLAGIVGFAAAARHARETLETEAARQTALREALEAGLIEQVPGVTIYGAEAERLPNTVCLTVAGMSSDKLLDRLERRGIFASSGAACSSGGSDPSHVLLAMGVAGNVALGAIRLSLGRDTQLADISEVVATLRAVAEANDAAGSNPEAPAPAH